MIKSFSVRDVLLVANLQKQGIALDLEERLIHPRSPLRSALLSTLLPAMPGASTYILQLTDENGEFQALAQTRKRPGRPEQDVVFMVPALEPGNGSHALWQRLITHLSVKAGEIGCQRIYVRLDSDGDEVQIFRNVGFSAYAQENVFVLDPSYSPASNIGFPGLRKQTEADSWSLQRLYAVVTPSAVQVAEGLAQGQWRINNYLIADQGRRYGYVWESQGEILAVMNFHSGKQGHWLRVMVHPEVIEEAIALIMVGLNLIKKYKRRPVYCSLRTYQLELESRLEACGFTKYGSQTVMVKHTTVRAKDFLSRLVPAFEGTVEAKHAAPTAMAQADVSVSRTINGNGKRPPRRLRYN